MAVKIGGEHRDVTRPDGKVVLVPDEKAIRKRQAVNRRFPKKNTVRVARKGQV